jgi:hypothetical protein
MADQKITQLTEATSAVDNDLLPIVVDTGSTPVTKKITKANLLEGLGGSVPMHRLVFVDFPDWTGVVRGLADLTASGTDATATWAAGNGIQLKSGSTSSSYARAHMVADLWDSAGWLTNIYDRDFFVVLQLNCTIANSSDDAEAYIGVGTYGLSTYSQTSKHIGFRFTQDAGTTQAIYATVGNGTNGTSVDITSACSGLTGYTLTYSSRTQGYCIVKSGTTCYFYVLGTLVATIDEYVPTGSYSPNGHLAAFAKNAGTSDNWFYLNIREAIIYVPCF